MSQWQNLLLSGNENFYNHQWSKAEHDYKSAYELLDNKWQHGSQHETLLIAWICTSHNLASLYEQQQDYIAALQYLFVAFNKVQAIVDSEEVSESLHTIALQAMNTTLSPILLFEKKHPVCDSCRRQIQQLHAQQADNDRPLH